MNTKVLVVLLTVLVILYLAGIGVGISNISKSSAEEQREIEVSDGELEEPGLMRRFSTIIPKDSTSFDDVRSSNNNSQCLDRNQQQLKVPARDLCVYFLKNDVWPRSLTIEMTAGISARLTLKQPAKEDDSPMRSVATLDVGQIEEFDLFSRSEEDDVVSLQIACRDTTETCRFILLEP